MPDFASRHVKARKLLGEHGFDALLAQSEPTVFYLTGAIASRPAGLILPADPSRELVLIVRGGEATSVAQGVAEGVKVVGTTRDVPSEKTVSNELAAAGLIGKQVAIEDHVITLEQYNALASKTDGIRLAPGASLVHRLRFVKDAEEIEHTREAAKVTDAAMGAAVAAIKAGKSETLAAAAAETVMRQNAMFISYETLIGSGFRSSLLRRFPSDVVPGPDDLVRLDLAAKRSFGSGFGYHTDQTRTLTPQKPSADQLDMLKANLEIHLATLEALKPGRSIDEICRESLRVVKGTKWESMSHMGGHGMGLEVHEWPSFNVNVDVVLEPNTIFAIEPGCTIPGVQATCFEDSVLITEAGHERLTTLPHVLWEE